MAKTETVYTRVEPKLKISAEQILATLGLALSEAVNIFLSQVVLHKGLPFDVKVPALTQEEAKERLMAELKKGEDSVNKHGWVSLEQWRTKRGLT